MANIRQRIMRFIAWIVATVVTLAVIAVAAVALIVWWLIEPDAGQFGHVEDEAKQAHRKVEEFPGAGEPYFAAMDKGLLLPPTAGADYPDEIKEVATATGLDPEAVRKAAIRGQNTWTVWTGGNDRFWDFAARATIGSFDLLKTISSHPTMAYGRDNRFRYLGLVNEPCFTTPKSADPDHWGLWIDQRKTECPADSFGGNTEADARYPGVRIGSRGTTVKVKGEEKKVPVGSYYGEPTGVMGLRLFPNPAFDSKAAEHWDAVRYYTDPSYYNDKDLVRPYRVGMSCAFCHVGPSPINPPKNVESPEFPEISSNPGAQYFWVDRIFFWNTKPRATPVEPAPNEGNFLFQLFHTNPPGSLDTSLVSSDYMNNPRTMNAVYNVLERLRIGAKTGKETIKGDEKDNKQAQDYPQTAAFGSLYDKATGTVASMRVLKDGADSVGTLGALNRVYLNIGLFSEEWLLHFRPFLGGQKISPIRITDAQKNSVYWQATETMTPDMAIFFLVAARADHLKDTAVGEQVLQARDPAEVDRGKIVFAENCAACHSSKQPVPAPDLGVDQGICAGGGAGPHYRECWDRYWAWAQSDAFKRGMVKLVTEKDEDGKDFLDSNYLSTERRVPMDVVRTNACSAIATNGLSGDVWDNFTSSTYKALPPPHEVTVNHPVSGAATPLQAAGNGRGYLRPPSLVSLWSTAPFLLNNSVGHEESYHGTDYYNQDNAGGYGAGRGTACPAADAGDPYLPCVENRLTVFDRSIRQMLSPQTRRMDKMTEAPVPGYIYRTSAPSCLIVPPGFVPDKVKPFTGMLNKVAGWAFKKDGSITVGPFPAGFPINALTNTELLPDNDEEDKFANYKRLIAAGPALIGAFSELGGQCTPEELANPAVLAKAEKVVRDTKLVDRLVGLSKCPDYVVNGGHTFGADLSQSDKNALISYLKQF
ncbi:hypothetical protein ELG72_29455 (plasmid) [Rhizobium leguminosarum]|uniref:hypothetical protein n=1 Tax=Rhizobium TaxID=379 RepID=UPI00102F8BD7|nr:hypothetical protein [Rhizobium leguminosarum]TBF25398.1 hypothetical protein ELG92_31625 [Rhizobium leguminosarum]TBF44352.1 hypothetical protein ELG91_30850 [Rhizobium leguminosarum]TBF45774.1 hypothetical protein ELG90_32840 [Rhizobium leguminosarum]TBF48125.1 hypothetical protein ELG87_30725 [Rhizobium leguminosarum]TBF66443.1 hypothetical protein ELG84_31950 [Rhizobium leguminosarum]